MAANYKKDAWSYQLFARILGKGVVTAEGAAWKKQRALLSPAFHSRSLHRFMPTFTSAVTRFRDIAVANGPNKPMEISEAFRTLTLEVIAEIVLGVTPEQSHVLPKLFVCVMDEMNLRVFAPYRPYLYPMAAAAHNKACDDMDALMASLISARRSQMTDGGRTAAKGHHDDDILGVLVSSPERLSDDLIADELKTMLLAGHETSSMMLTWALYLLGKHLDEMEAAVKVVDDLFDAHPTPSREDYRTHPAGQHLTNVLKEGMRLFNPVPALTRMSVADDVVCGVPIPANTRVTINMWSVHHSPSVWGADVESFRPGRFGEEESRARHNFGFCPFSLGKRNCVGQQLAYLEGQVVLSHILRWFRVRLIAKHPEVESHGFMIPVRPEHGVFVTLSPREGV